MGAVVHQPVAQFGPLGLRHRAGLGLSHHIKPGIFSDAL